MHPFSSPSPPRRKGIPVYAIVLGAIGAVLLLGGLLIGGLVWRAWRSLSEADRADVEEGVAESWRAVGALGAREVHDLGCTASVIDVSTMPSLTKDYANSDGKAPPVDVGIIVRCDVLFPWTPPSCQRIAATYVQAAAPKEPFRVMVNDTKHKLSCNEKFDTSGVELPPGGT